MPNTINLRLLDNKNIIAEMNGISLGQENSYKIIAGEENATIFKIVSKPTKYTNATYTVEMVNSQGYGIEETDIINDTFDLPKGMAIAGYGWVQIRAYYTNNEGKEEVVPFITLKVKVWNTLPNWKEHISEGGTVSNIEIDSKLSLESKNPVQNKVITEELNKVKDFKFAITDDGEGNVTIVSTSFVENAEGGSY